MSLKPERDKLSATRTIGWSALAAVLALTSMPATVFAQDRDGGRIGGLQVQGQPNQNRSGGENRGGGDNRGGGENRGGGDNRGGGLRVTQSQQRSETRSPSTAPQNAPRQVQQQPRQVPQQQTYQNRDNGLNRGDQRSNQPRNVQRTEPRRSADTRRDGNWRNNNDQRREANPTSYDRRWENNQRANDRRDNDRRDNNWRNNDRRDNNWRNNDRGSSANDSRRWNHEWRNNNRYDWQSYRTQNRNTYRIGRYSAPYRNYNYRRVGVGLTLGSLFYSNRYWVNDPWQYRLPEVYGPYRWVRYYDDVILVNTYTGEVVDVIYDFFW